MEGNENKVHVENAKSLTEAKIYETGDRIPMINETK